MGLEDVGHSERVADFRFRSAHKGKAFNGFDDECFAGRLICEALLTICLFYDTISTNYTKISTNIDKSSTNYLCFSLFIVSLQRN